MDIYITDEEKKLTEEHEKLLKDLLNFVAKKEELSREAELSLTIVNNDDIQTLNNQFRDKDRPTDVLSFPMGEEWIEIEGMPLVLGDIIISYEKIEEQAKEYNHAYERELCFLAVHGLLHLLGYTHDDEEEEKIMFNKQENYLKEFNLER